MDQCWIHWKLSYASFTPSINLPIFECKYQRWHKKQKKLIDMKNMAIATYHTCTRHDEMDLQRSWHSQVYMP